jgi:hypothetical protein
MTIELLAENEALLKRQQRVGEVESVKGGE